MSPETIIWLTANNAVIHLENELKFRKDNEVRQQNAAKNKYLLYTSMHQCSNISTLFDSCYNIDF